MTRLDFARCPGVSYDGQWREGCDDCLRRESPETSEAVYWITPPEIVVFECEFRVAAE